VIQARMQRLYDRPFLKGNHKVHRLWKATTSNNSIASTVSYAILLPNCQRGVYASGAITWLLTRIAHGRQGIGKAARSENKSI